MSSILRRGGRKSRLLLRTILMAAVTFLVVAGCTPAAIPGGTPVSGEDTGSGNPSFRGELPEGWDVYLPEMEFSTVAVVDGVVLAGGLHGLYRYVPATDSWSAMDPKGKPLRLIKSIKGDAEGNVWMGHEDGLTCLPAGSLELPDSMEAALHIQEIDGKRMKAVHSVLVASDGTVYAGTYNGAVMLKPKTVTNWISSGELNGAAVLGTEDGLTHSMVNVLFEDSRNALWFGAYIARGGGVSCLKGETVQQFNHSNGLPDDYVTTIAEDTEGAIWVGTGVYTSGGAARFVYENGAYRAAGMRLLADGLAGEKVRYIHLDALGRLWFCSEYDGIAVFDAAGTRVALLTEEMGLPDNEVKQMVQEMDGSVWFACRRGLLRIRAEAMEKIGL